MNCMYLKIIELKTIGSTNTYAADLAKKGAKEVVVVRAQAQTHGRGRRRRCWASPEGKGIYVSFLLRPDCSLKEAAHLPLIFSLGVVKTINKIIKAKIKKPNDVIAGKKKLAGVLVEIRSQKSKVDFCVAGVGLNVNTGKKQLVKGATSLYQETGRFCDLDSIFKRLIKEELKLYRAFRKGKIKELLKEVKDSS